jgi:integrase
VKRDRVLTDAEIGAIWTAAGKLGAVHGGFVRFLMLTLARRDEVARMTWAEVAPDLSTWTLPAARAKNGKAHVTHLPAPARDILSTLPRGGDDALVFGLPGANRKEGDALRPIGTFSFIARVLLRESKTEGWRLHDFRRTGVTVLASKGVSPHVADRLLNHVQGTIKGVAAIYQRHEFMAERRAALEAWAGHILGSSPAP